MQTTKNIDTNLNKISSLLGISNHQADLLLNYLSIVKNSGFGNVSINIKGHESYNVTMTIDGPPDDKMNKSSKPLVEISHLP